MRIKNYATALPAVAGLAALLLTACSSGASSHPSAGTTTSPAQAPVASTVTVTDQEDSNWAGYVVASSATAKTSFSAVSGSWTQPAADCSAGSPAQADASPGALSGNGSSFTVNWQRPQIQMPAPPGIVSGPIYN